MRGSAWTRIGDLPAELSALRMRQQNRRADAIEQRRTGGAHQLLRFIGVDEAFDLRCGELIEHRIAHLPALRSAAGHCV